MNTISLLCAAAENLFEQHQYTHCAKVLEIAKTCDITVQQNRDIRDNLRHCYFRSGNIAKAIDLLIEQQADQGLSMELTREYANCLRYLGRYQESLAITESVSDRTYRCLDHSWHLHRAAKHRQAFAMTEQGRPDFGWSCIAVPSRATRWRGEPVQHLVLLEEAGDGDMVLFSRWIPLLESRCDRVWYTHARDMDSVFTRNFGISTISGWDQITGPLAVLPMMSLAHVLNIDSFAQSDAYLQAHPDWVFYYNRLLPKQGPRIGICWSGHPDHLENDLRSLPSELMISHLAPLGEILNLQYGESAPPGVLSPDLENWEHTMALINTCDVVVSADTAVAHVASAMGRPTLVLTNRACYYTWNSEPGMHRSHWYPHAWNITQQEPGQWDEVMSQAAVAVARLLGTYPGSLTGELTHDT